MAKITVTGYEVSCDPGINNITSYKGEIDTKDITPDMDLERVITDPWWRSSIGPKFGKSEKVEQVGLSYAYGELYVKIEQ